MATFRLRHFSNPHTLRALEPGRLSEFLQPYRDFFVKRGYELPSCESDEQLQYERLIVIFMSPAEDTPQDLLDALYLIDEMSTHEGMSSLLDAVVSEGIILDRAEDVSPTDIAIQIWNQNRELLERKHAEQFLYKPKSFECYLPNKGDVVERTELSKTSIHRLEADLDDWFEEKRRGRGCRVFMYSLREETRFLVRHGEPFKREESLTTNDVTSVCYRPLKYDVVVFDHRRNELRVNARLVGEKKLYRELFGRYLFDNTNAFPEHHKYTLEPLQEYGVDALSCGDIEGIDSIVLTEVHILWGGAHREVEVRKAGDVFAAYDDRGRELPQKTKIIKATFKVTFSESRTPRSVKVRLGNVAEYTRDSDAALIEQWLQLRGFVIGKDAGKHVAQAMAIT